MSTFISKGITKAGNILIARQFIGEKINFTRIVLGDGYLTPEQNISDLTSVINHVVDLNIIKLIENDETSVTVGGFFSNSEITFEFFYRELALYAQGANGVEVLYSYANAGDFAEKITPIAEGSSIEKIIDIITAVGAAANVTAKIVRATTADEISFNDNVSKLGAGSVQEAVEMLAGQVKDKTNYLENRADNFESGIENIKKSIQSVESGINTVNGYFTDGKANNAINAGYAENAGSGTDNVARAAAQSAQNGVDALNNYFTNGKANTAETANYAYTANSTNEAAIANHAINAEHATSAETAGRACNAGYAESAGFANTAANAENANTINGLGVQDAPNTEPNKLVRTDHSGHINTGYIICNTPAQTPHIANVITDAGDGYFRRTTLDHFKNNIAYTSIGTPAPMSGVNHEISDLWKINTGNEAICVWTFFISKVLSNTLSSWGSVALIPSGFRPLAARQAIIPLQVPTEDARCAGGVTFNIYPDGTISLTPNGNGGSRVLSIGGTIMWRI